MASITKRGKKYLIRWRDPDGEQRARAVHRLGPAQKLRREIEDAVDLGRRWEPAESRALPGLAGMMRAFSDDRIRTKRPNTVVGDMAALQQFRQFLATKYPRSRQTADMLTRAHLVSFDAGLRDTGRSTPTANKRTQTIQRMWEWCADSDEYGWATPRPRRIEFPSPAFHPARAPTWAEMDAVADVATGWVRDLVVLLRMTGLRQGQVMGLVWDDFDLDGGWLTVRGELGKTKQERAGRIVPISPHLVEHLAGMGRREGWVVAPHKRQRKSYPDRMRTLWEQTAAPAAVYKSPNHAFRKGFVSALKAMRADTEAVEGLVGHAIPGSRGHYLDPTWASGLREVVEMIPPIGASNVVRLGRAEEG